MGECCSHSLTCCTTAPSQKHTNTREIQIPPSFSHNTGSSRGSWLTQTCRTSLLLCTKTYHQINRRWIVTSTIIIMYIAHEVLKMEQEESTPTFGRAYQFWLALWPRMRGCLAPIFIESRLLVIPMVLIIGIIYGHG